MDTTETITHVSLCSGYGGIDLGIRAALPALRTIAYCEREAFPISVLLKRIEEGQLDVAPIHTDLKAFPWELFRDRVSILSGGYPCQPFSAAGNRLGKSDPRHLWPWIKDGIELMRPHQCFFENVDGHVSMGLNSVISDLEELGYKTTFGIFSASEAGSGGAPHQRKRVFILADRIDSGSQGRLLRWSDTQGQSVHGHAGCGSTSLPSRWPARPGERQHDWEPPRVLENTKLVGRGRGHHGDAAGDGGEVQVEGSRSRQVGDSLGLRLESTRDQGAVGEACGNASGERGEPSSSTQVAGHSGGQQLADSQSSGTGDNLSGLRQGSGGNHRGEIRAQQLGNPSSIRPHRGGEDGDSKQPEMFGSGSSEDGGLGDSEYAGSHGSPFTRSVTSSSHDDPQGTNFASELARAGRPDLSGDLQASLVADTDGNGSGEDRQSTELRSTWTEQSSFDCGNSDQRQSIEVGLDGSTEGEDNCQVESEVCGGFDGSASGLGYAELCNTYDNRTHELRCLGNGVVPSQCTHAYRTLIVQLRDDT